MAESTNFERALQLYEFNRYKEAIPYFKNELAQNIDNFDAKLYLTYCYLQTEDISLAKNLSKELLKEEPNYAPVYHLKSQIAIDEDRYDDALIAIDTAISLDAFNSNNFGLKSYIFINKKKFEEALNFANEGLRIDSKSRICLNARTTCLTKLNRKEEAQQTIENLLNDDPENAYSHANVGWTELENNNINQALIHFKESLKLDPNQEYGKDGMVTAIKAKNKIYNFFLRYNFWIDKQSGKNQIFIIIGIYLVYRFSINILSEAGFTFLLVPLIIVYLLFALGTWIMEPLSNMILNFDKNGKYLLDNNAKLSGWFMFSFLSLSIVSYGLNFASHNDTLLLYSIAFLAAVLPFSRAPQNSIKNSQLFDYVYGASILLTPTIGSFLGYDYDSLFYATVLLFVGYTWLGSLIFR